MNLRERARVDMKRQNQKDWGLLAILIAPDGTVQDVDAETGEPLKTIMTLSDFLRSIPDTGDDMIEETPVATFALSSLLTVPVAGQSWYMKLQLKPDGDLFPYLITSVRSPEGGASVGYIKLFAMEVEQS